MVCLSPRCGAGKTRGELSGTARPPASDFMTWPKPPDPSSVTRLSARLPGRHERLPRTGMIDRARSLSGSKPCISLGRAMRWKRSKRSERTCFAREKKKPKRGEGARIAEFERERREHEVAKARAAQQQADARRLETYRVNARWSLIAFPSGSPARAEVEEFLTSLTSNATEEYVAARVAAILQPYREAQNNARRVAELIEGGMSHARMQTLGSEWDYDSAKEAQAEAEAILRRKVQPDWTAARVASLVDAILDRWA